MRDRAAVRALACLLATLSASATAWAGEGESALSLGAGYATYVVPDGEDGNIAPAAGALAHATFERAFAEAYSWRLDAAGAVYGGAGTGTAGAGFADIGLVYRLDVLKYVPYLALSGGVAYGGGGALGGDLDADGEQDCAPSDGGCGGGLTPLVQLGGGLDVLRGRDSSWGIELRVASLLGDTTYAGLTLRTTRRWGYF